MKYVIVLGLKGNNLTHVSVLRLQEILKENRSFPLLMWINMEVNNGVNTFPRKLVQLLVSRWPAYLRDDRPMMSYKCSPLDIIQHRTPRPFCERQIFKQNDALKMTGKYNNRDGLRKSLH